MDSIVFKNGYIDADDFNHINKSTRNLILAHWIHSKNKFTQKQFYIKPQLINNDQKNMHFDLLKIACGLSTRNI